jgi:hypothetical protein
MTQPRATYERVEARIAARKIPALHPVTVTLAAGEWANLLRALHRAQPQLGRLAWLSIGSVEAQMPVTAILNS